jgi:hypothetical protein
LTVCSENTRKVVAERKEREQASQPGGGGKGDGDWRKKRKEAFQQASLAVGLYQIEEILL